MFFLFKGKFLFDSFMSHNSSNKEGFLIMSHVLFSEKLLFNYKIQIPLRARAIFISWILLNWIFLDIGSLESASPMHRTTTFILCAQWHTLTPRPINENLVFRVFHYIEIFFPLNFMLKYMYVNIYFNTKILWKNRRRRPRFWPWLWKQF